MMHFALRATTGDMMDPQCPLRVERRTRGRAPLARQSELMNIAGTLTTKIAHALRKVYDQMIERAT